MSTRTDETPRQEKPTEEIFEPDPNEEIKVSFLLDKEVLSKIKSLARKTNVLPKDLINQALCEKIQGHEEAHGTIESLQDEDYF